MLLLQLLIPLLWPLAAAADVDAAAEAVAAAAAAEATAAVAAAETSLKDHKTNTENLPDHNKDR